ncbi:uncharacterized protein LOC111489005 isoform X2 [Cucurbita maxima]|nr:uncharacterized protein LOC111489005 isoform X2 [Cucurbita maxima]
MGVHFQLCTMTIRTGTQSKFNHRIITISLAKREARIGVGSPTMILTMVLIKILRILRILLHPLFRRLISFSCILIFIFTTRYCPAVFSLLLSNSSNTISITQSTSTWEKIRAEQRRDLRICRMECVAIYNEIEGVEFQFPLSSGQQGWRSKLSFSQWYTTPLIGFLQASRFPLHPSWQALGGVLRNLKV